MILEFERAERVRDAFERVRDAVRVVVHRIDAPRITRAVVMREADPVDDRVAHIDVRRRHVDLRAQHMFALGEFAGAHPPEQIEVLGRDPAAVRRGAARFGQRTAVHAHFFSGLAVDIGLAALDQDFGEMVERLVVIAREVQMRLAGLFQLKPSHRTASTIESTYSMLSFSGFVSSRRRWQTPS